MKRKHLILSLILLGILLAIIALQRISLGPKGLVQLGLPNNPLENWQILRITQAEKELILSKEADGQVAIDADFTVDPESVSALEKVFNELELVGPIANNPENFAVLGLDQESGREVKIANDDGEEYGFSIGNPSIYVNGEYLLGREGNEVFAASKSLSLVFSIDDFYWQYKNVFQAPQSVNLEFSDTAFSLENRNGDWWLDGNVLSESGQDLVANALTIDLLQRVAADQLIATLDEQPPTAILKVRESDEKNYEWRVIENKADENWYGWFDVTAGWYQLDSGQVRRLLALPQNISEVGR